MQGRCDKMSVIVYLGVYWGATDLVLLKAVLKDILDNQAASLAERNFVPHALERLIDVSHDLRRRLRPSQLEQLLPNMACVAVNNSLRDATEKLVDHNCLVVLGNRVKSLLDDMAAESVH